MTPALRVAVGQALSARVESAEAVSGGDINEAFRVLLADGSVVFVKTNAHADPAMFPAEARGLAWLTQAPGPSGERAPGVLRIPRVLAHSAGREMPAFLALEWLEPGPRGRTFDEDLGRGLALLHRSGAPAFGLDHDNFIGRLRQSNASRGSWAAFYRDQRLAAQLRAATDSGLTTPGMRAGFDRILLRLEDLVGPDEPPSRLHGDLWAGNVHTDGSGAPCLVDPAVYGGHREMDLAMMHLFGGFSEHTFSAYAESFPLPEGHRERVSLCQIYPLLVHLNLFGSGYAGAVQRALGAYT